jgi:putative Mg2+ transporter-C (MgtC) family protein
MFETTGNIVLDSHWGKIAIAYLITLPLGWLREKEAHSVGLRTFPIVAVASCGYLLITKTGASSDAFTRVLQGLIAGIGFIGGGAILKDGATVHGAATAASIWNTGVIGAAVALGNYDIAIILVVINILTLKGLAPLKKKLAEPDPVPTAIPNVSAEKHP